ncbi:MAG: SOS response-associated peptidase [Pyrinomonadaceae bacterium]|nr:SOS response-associated peptidase [Pyrinomonadaceae bacterium]
MCGRYVLDDPALAGEEYRIETDEVPWRPSYNIAPTQKVMVVRERPDGVREAVPMQWWLIPSWSKTDQRKYPTFNARCESLSLKPTWSKPFRQTRCIIPSSAFIEWKKLDSKTKQPYLIYIKDKPIQSFAGVWDSWTNRETGEVLESCSIITTEANDLVAEIHDKKRMPVFLHPEEYDEWLDPENHDTDQLERLFKPYPSEAMAAHKIGSKIGSPKHNSPELIEPIE